MSNNCSVRVRTSSFGGILQDSVKTLNQNDFNHEPIANRPTRQAARQLSRGFTHAFQAKPSVLSIGPMELYRGRKLLVLQAANRYRQRRRQSFGPHEDNRSAGDAECLLQPLSRRAGSPPGSGLALLADNGGIRVDRPVGECGPGASLALRATARISAARLPGEDEFHVSTGAGRGACPLALMHAPAPRPAARSPFETMGKAMQNRPPRCRAKAPAGRSRPWRAAPRR